jgi:hypothetical protein
MNRGRTTVLAVLAVAVCAGCTSDGSSSNTTAAPSSAPTTTAVAVTTIEATTTTTTAVPATDAPTTAPTTVPQTTAPAPSTACPTGTTIPSAATNLVAINGDIDGDTLNDVVTSYALDGVPHVHATLATGGNSDAEVPIGNADTVSIQFMDFDHALGAAVPPPVAVLAIGPTKAGTAVGAF